MNLIPQFTRKSIQAKMFAGFITILLLLIAVVAVSYTIIIRLGKASEQILKMNYNSIIASVEMLDDLESIHREYISYSVVSNPRNDMKLADAHNSFAMWLGRSIDNITEEGEKEALADIERLFNIYTNQMHAYKYEDMNLQQRSSLDSLRIQIKEKCLTLLQINQKAMFSKSLTAQNISKRGSATLLIVAVLVMILGILMSWGLSRRIVRPILLLKEATNKLAVGDYSMHLKPESEDELGILTTEFDIMATKLHSFNELNVKKIIEEQQKIEAIFANIEDGIFFVGLDYSILDANQPALDAFNLKRKDVIGRHFLEIIKQNTLFDDLKICMETQSPKVYSESNNQLTIKHKDKQEYFEYTFTPIIAQNKELLGVMFLLKDITNLKNLDRLKSEFVMIVSHELKTPLTSLSMSIDLIKESLGETARKEDIELISIAKEEITRLKLLISDLLDLSKIEAGKIDMHFAVAYPDQVLESVSHYFKTLVEEKEIELGTECSTDIGGIWCDEEKLMLVFSNLVSNAIKAIGTKGRILLSAEKSGSYAVFCVKDSGVGIPLAYQNRIFDRFVQVQDHKSSGGTGLGLTISKEIIRAHGGSIWVESEQGNGAAFFFTIPLETSQIIK